MEPEEFVGCILNIRTQPSAADGASKAIIGTVRNIDQKRQTITLDDVMINGTIVDDGYVLNSAVILDLTVCGKIEPEPSFDEEDKMFNTVPAQVESAFASTPKKPLQTSNSGLNNQLVDADLIQFPGNVELQVRDLTKGNTSKPKPPAGGSTSKKVNNVNVPAPHQHGHTKSSAFVKPDKSPKSGNSKNNTNPFYAINPALGGAMGKGPPPTKPSGSQIAKISQNTKISDARVVYTASDLEKEYFDHESKSPTKSKVLESIMAEFSAKSIQMTKQTTTLFQNVCVPIVPRIKPLEESVQDQNVDPAATVSNITADSPLYKLIAPSQLQGRAGYLPAHKNQLSQPTNNSGAGRDKANAKADGLHALLLHKNIESDRVRNAKNDRSGGVAKVQQHTGGGDKAIAGNSAFEMTTDEIKAQEFDFEENLAMFEKLPVSSPPKKSAAKEKKSALHHAPEFGKSDTTYYAERHVSSIQLKESPVKVFVTDTGVVVPAVSLTTRSQILNLAHNFGFTHERMVEITGRAVAQTAIPMLGDAYRLSPEREEDRPTVLVFAGPHWNGAVALCSARILATQGIRTIVYIWNYELPLLTIELQLYRLTKQKVITDLKDLKWMHIDLVIGGMHDHRDNTIQNPVFLKCCSGKPVVLVDPPLQPSYRQHFMGTTSVAEPKLAIVTPTLPLAYPTEPSVKLHLVNLGIPQGIFEQNEVMYKSPFGDKLILQLFPTKQDISANAN